MIVIGGDAIVDLIDRGNQTYEACPGGSTLNCALATSLLGSSVLYVSTLSTDTYGQLLVDRLTECGVRVPEKARSNANSSLAVVSLDASFQPSYAFYREGTADREVPVERIISEFPEQMSVFHVGSCALIPRADQDAWLAIVKAAKRRGACISIDPNCRPSMTPDPAAYRQGIARFFALADLIKLSDEDLSYLHPDWADDALDQFVAQYRPPLVVMTRGPEGVTAITRSGNRGSAPAVLPGIMADTVGAGDSIHGTLLAEIDRLALSPESLAQLDQDTLDAMLTLATQVAGVNCTRVGCQPPTREELRQYYG